MNGRRPCVVWVLVLTVAAVGIIVQSSAAPVTNDVAAELLPEQYDDDEAEIPEGQTCLLQTRLEHPARSGHGLPPPDPRSMPDVPEAGRAWALFQHVPDGPATPEKLSNGTDLEAPGYPPGGVRELQRKLAGKMEYVPQKDTGPETPEWAIKCMGRIKVHELSSWNLNDVTTPQIVPYIVPLGHPNRTGVSVVVAPGGAGEILAWQAEGTDIAKWLNSRGISAFVLKYRVPWQVWGFAPSVMDAQRAVSLVRHIAPSVGLNASQVGLYGASHGGWLATFTTFAARRQYARRDAVDDQSPRPDFLLLLYPEIMETVFAERARSSSPTAVSRGVELGDLKGAPPTFVAIGQNDGCCSVDSVYSLHQSLRARGPVVMEINVYTDVGHGFSMCHRMSGGGIKTMKHEACLWMERARRFIMWNVEQRTPEDVESTYREVLKFNTSLLAPGA